MKISASTMESSVLSNNRQRTVKHNSVPAFGGYRNYDGKLLNDVKKSMGKVPKFLFWIEQLKGENINAIITALGTAFVAPIFIRFNPLSDADAETKAYTAWRQPISAVFQILTAFSVLLPFNHWMDKQASSGRWESVDLRAKPAEGLVERVIALQHPEYNKEQLAVEVAKYQDNCMRKAIDEAREKMKDKVITDDMLVSREDFEEALKKLQDAPENQKLSSQELTTKAMDAAKKDVLEKLDIKAETKFRVRQYNDGTYTVESAIDNAKGQLNSVTAKVTEAMKKAGVQKEADLPVSDIALKKEKEILTDVLRRLELTKDYEAKAKKEAFNSLKDLGKTKEAIMKNLRIKQFVEANASKAKFSYDRLRMWTGMGVALVALIPSCLLLNYFYPRIMEKIMPHASKKKKQDQQVQQSPVSQKAKEVK